MATLTEARGSVQRDFSQDIEQWQAAEILAEFDLGDGVRTLDHATGTVAFDDGALMRLEPKTTVRFLAARPNSGERKLDVQAGDAIFEAGDSPMRIRTQMGVAVLDSGSVARISKGDRGFRVFVRVGLARLEANGVSEELSAGQGVEVGIGMAILDRFTEETPASSVESTVSASAPASEEVPTNVAVTIVGNGALVQRVGTENFEPLASGKHTLDPGTRLKLTGGDQAELSRGPASADLSGPGTFLLTSDPRRLVEPVLGVVTLRADGRDVSMDIPKGTLTALGSEAPSVSEVRLEKTGRVKLRVRAGKLKVELPGGSNTLSAGETGDVEHGELTIGGRGPDYFDVVTIAGSPLVVHDPSPPTAVRLVFDEQCSGVGVVKVRTKSGTTSSSGTRQANVLFARGRHTYELECLSSDGTAPSVVAKGAVTILADAGTLALPNKPPANVVNTDGRSYTLLYQNLLPAVTVRWPDAPPADAYTLVLTSPNGSRSYSTASASRSFAAGHLSEGTHSFQWKASSGRASRLSKATIRFDNRAPRASIRSPENRSFAPGASVSVSGIALPGWEVRAQGEPLGMDSQQRFSGTVASGPRGLVLQFSHPSRGTHHYLRRASGIAQ